MRNIREVLAWHLRALRGDRTQLEMAVEAGIPMTTYQRMESGKFWPEYKNIKKISQAHGINETVIFMDPDYIAKISPAQALKVLSDTLDHWSPQMRTNYGSDKRSLDEKIEDAKTLFGHAPSTKNKKRGA